MDTRMFESIIEVIRDEAERRQQLLVGQDPDFADDYWQFHLQPLVNELCLMFLVVMWHRVERDLLWAAGRLAGGVETIDRTTHQKNVDRWREDVRKSEGRKRCWSELRLSQFGEWTTSMRSLNLLANSYKHSPWATPDDKLIRHLNQMLRRGKRPHRVLQGPFAELHESDELKGGLALSLGLDEDAPYWQIAEEFMGRVSTFLATVENQPHLSRIERSIVSNDPATFLR